MENMIVNLGLLRSCKNDIILALNNKGINVSDETSWTGLASEVNKIQVMDNEMVEAMNEYQDLIRELNNLKFVLNTKFEIETEDRTWSQIADDIEHLELETGGGGSEPEEVYDPVLDDYTHIFFTPSLNSNNYFYVNPSSDSPTIIDWGDGSDATVLTEPGIQLVEHIYSLPSASSSNNGVGAAYYTQVEIKIYNEMDSYTIEGTSSQQAWGNMTNVTEVIPANNCAFGDYGLYGCKNITNIKFSKLQVGIPQRCFYDTYCLKNINLNGFRIISQFAFNYCYGLEEIEIPSSIKTIGTNAFANCYNLRKVIWNSPQMFIQNSTFSSCNNLEILDLRNATQIMRFGASNTSTTSGSYSYICPNSGKLKILVPKNLYNSWKKSTYWRYFWQFLYWVDDEGNYRNDTVA